MWAIFIDEDIVTLVDQPEGHGEATVYPYRQIEDNLPAGQRGQFKYRIENGEVVGERVAPVISLDTLKAHTVGRLKDKTNEILSETDWYIVRAYETGDPAPQDIVNYRADIRAVCNTKEAELLGLSTAEELNSFSLSAIDWPVDPRLPVVDPADKI